MNDEATIARCREEDPAVSYRGYLEGVLGNAFVKGNSIRVLRNGVQIFPAMIEAIEAARESICLTTFVYWTGDIARRVADALAGRAREGVRVRVVLDAVGAYKMSRELVEGMASAGVQIRWFRPFSPLRPWHYDKRTHRKILVCDGLVAFTGGVGIAHEWEGDARSPQQMRETHVRITGPALIGLQAAFLDNWNESGPWDNECSTPGHREATGSTEMQVVRASSTIGWTGAATLVRTLVGLARRSVRITTGYFTPDDTLVGVLVDAVQRGVEVQIITPGRNCDHQASRLAGHRAIQRLLDAGVTVWTYDRATMHAKVMTIDGVVASIGSINMNHRSMGKDEECSVLALSPTLAEELDAHFAEDCEASTRLEAGEFRRRSAWLKLRERAARLVVGQL